MALSKFCIHKVPEIIRKEVEWFILNRFRDAEKVTINVFPSGLPGIVFHHNQGQPAIENIGVQSIGAHIYSSNFIFHGAGIESSVMNFGKGSYTVMQVVLKPHAVKALFGISALQLKSGALELNEFSRENIIERLLNAHSDQERVALLEKFLIANLEKEKTRDGLVEESLRVIHKSVGMINVKTLLDHLHISERHFERRFSEAVGISPLSYIRGRRFNEALRLIKTGQYNLYNV